MSKHPHAQVMARPEDDLVQVLFELAGPPAALGDGVAVNACEGFGVSSDCLLRKPPAVHLTVQLPVAGVRHVHACDFFMKGMLAHEGV